MKFWFSLGCLFFSYLTAFALPESPYLLFKKTDFSQLMDVTSKRLKKNIAVSTWEKQDRAALLQTMILMGVEPENLMDNFLGNNSASCEEQAFRLYKNKNWDSEQWQKLAIEKSFDTECIKFGTRILLSFSQYNLALLFIQSSQNDNSKNKLDFYLNRAMGLASFKVGKVNEWKVWRDSFTKNESDESYLFVMGLDSFLSQKWEDSVVFWEKLIAHFMAQKKLGKYQITEEFRWAHYYKFLSFYFLNTDKKILRSEILKVQRLFLNGYVAIWLNSILASETGKLTMGQLGLSSENFGFFLGHEVVLDNKKNQISISNFKRIIPLHLMY